MLNQRKILLEVWRRERNAALQLLAFALGAMIGGEKAKRFMVLALMALNFKQKYIKAQFGATRATCLKCLGILRAHDINKPKALFENRTSTRKRKLDGFAEAIAADFGLSLPGAARNVLAGIIATTGISCPSRPHSAFLGKKASNGSEWGFFRLKQISRLKGIFWRTQLSRFRKRHVLFSKTKESSQIP
jgi:hypothetical protein